MRLGRPVPTALRALSLVERRSWSKFNLHYTWGTNGVNESKMDVILHGFMHGIKCIMSHGHLSWFLKPPHGLTQNLETMPLQDLPTIDLCFHLQGPHINRNTLKLHFVEDPITYDFTLHLRARDHTTWCLEATFRHFFWALTISWSRLLAHVWSGPKGHFIHKLEGPWPLHSKIHHWLKRPRPSKFTSHSKMEA